jgi:hypothetical protein
VCCNCVRDGCGARGSQFLAGWFSESILANCLNNNFVNIEGPLLSGGSLAFYCSTVALHAKTTTFVGPGPSSQSGSCSQSAPSWVYEIEALQCPKYGLVSSFPSSLVDESKPDQVVSNLEMTWELLSQTQNVTINLVHSILRH